MSVSLKPSRRTLRVFACAAFVLLAACTVTIDTEGEPQERSLMDRLPAGATAVAWIDVGGLAAVVPEERWNRYADTFEDDEDMQDLERFIEATGMDPREDIAQIAFAALPEAQTNDDYLVLMAASFDRERVEALTAGAETISYEGTTFWESEAVFRNLGDAVGRPEAEGAEVPGDVVDTSTRPPGYVAILDDATLALGSEASLRAAVDVGGGNRAPITSDATMSGLIGDVYDQGQIWFVAQRETWAERVDALGGGAGVVPSGAIDSIEVLTMTVQMAEGMNVRLSAFAADADGAAELTTSLKGLVAMGRMMLQEGDPKLFEILDRGVVVGQEDRAVRLDINLTDADLEALQRMAEEQMPNR